MTQNDTKYYKTVLSKGKKCDKMLQKVQNDQKMLQNEARKVRRNRMKRNEMKSK